MVTQTTKRISIDKIIIDEESLPRKQINEDNVNNLLQAFKEGAELPLPDIFFDGKRYVIGDGRHRYEALIRAGRKMINAVIHAGDTRQAFFFSCGANGKHGLPLTNPEKREMVDKILRDTEWKKLSDRIIAKHCAVSPRFVGKIRHELTVNGVQSPSRRTGAEPTTRGYLMRIAYTLTFLHSKGVKRVHLLGSSKPEVIIICAAALDT